MIREADIPDTSKIRPVDLDVSGGRTKDVIVVYINDYGKYQRVVGYWQDVRKQWMFTSSGLPINHEIVRTE